MKIQCDRQSWRESRSFKNGTQIGEQSTVDEKRKKSQLHQLATDLDPQQKHQRDQGNRSGAGQIPLFLTDPVLGAVIVKFQYPRIHTVHDLKAEAVAAAPTLHVIGAVTETHEGTTANAIGMTETVVAGMKQEALPIAWRQASEKKAVKTLLDGCLNQLVLAEAKR